HATQTRNEYAGGPVLEIWERQSQEMAEHRTAQHRVDTIAGMNDEVLPQPAEAGREQQGDAEPDTDDSQRAHGLMGNDLVDDDLCQQRRSEAQHLHDSRHDQYITPDRFVLEKLRQEPAK